MITENLFALLLLDVHTTFPQNFKKIGDIEFFRLVYLAYFAPYMMELGIKIYTNLYKPANKTVTFMVKFCFIYYF